MLPGQGPFGLGFEGSIEVCQRASKRGGGRRRAIRGSVSSEEPRTSILHIVNRG